MTRRLSVTCPVCNAELIDLSVFEQCSNNGTFRPSIESSCA